MARSRRNRRGRAPRVLQGAPEALAARAQDEETVAVVNLRPEVLALVMVVLAEMIHRGERGDAEPLDLAAEVEASRHVDLRFDTRPDVEGVGARKAWPLQLGEDLDRLLAGLRLHDVERGEARKLLGRRGRRIDRKAARRQAVAVVHAERAEVAGAEERYELVVEIGPVERVVQPEAGDAGSCRFWKADGSSGARNSKFAPEKTCGWKCVPSPIKRRVVSL